MKTNKKPMPTKAVKAKPPKADPRRGRGRIPRPNTERTAGMLNVIEALDEQEKSMTWLADELGFSRQAVAAWTAVPPELIKDVARIVGIPKERVRPELY